MLVSDVEVRPVRGVRPGASAAEAVAVMGRSLFSIVPVLDANGDLVGVVTRSAAARAGQMRGDAVLVADVMVPEPPSVFEHDGLSHARTVFACIPWEELPVTAMASRRLVGILRRADALADAPDEGLDRDRPSVLEPALATGALIRGRL